MPFQAKEYMLPCLNKKLFGFDCLGCGMQRSLLFISKGEFIEAFKIVTRSPSKLRVSIALATDVGGLTDRGGVVQLEIKVIK